MKFAVLSDIHGNWEALEAVLAEADRRGVEGYVCLGDIVGYGADPGPCLDRIRELPANAVLGNHDAAICGLANIKNFNDYARDAILWTKDRIDREARDYLSALPLTRTIGNIALVHSSLDSPRDWGYVISQEEAWKCFDRLEGPCCLIGHSHIPCHFRLDAEEITGGPWRRLALEDGSRYIINPGSVGQPRDGDNRSSFTLADPEEKTFELVRVPYDIAASQKKIIAAGLPKFLAARLGSGR